MVAAEAADVAGNLLSSKHMERVVVKQLPVFFIYKMADYRRQWVREIPLNYLLSINSPSSDQCNCKYTLSLPSGSLSHPIENEFKACPFMALGTVKKVVK